MYCCNFAAVLKNLRNIVVVGLLILVSSSCSKYQKLLKSDDYEMKYQKAMEFYDKGDYYRALNLFDMVIPFYRGEKESEEIAYRYAYAYYKQADYILANYYFGRFTQTFPRSEKAEECAYMKAYCKYLEAPDYNLDQTNSIEAISELQLFADKYPESERLAGVNKLIEELHGKLQRKYFEVGELYMHMQLYKSVIQSFDVLLNDYPDTQYKEKANYYKIKAYYEYANKSVDDKKEERYKEAFSLAENFLLNFPEGEYVASVKKLNTRIKEKLNLN